MSHTPIRDSIERAHAAKRGLAAFNVITLEHAEAIVAGAESTGLPVILQLSQNAIKFHNNSPKPIAAALVAIAEASTTDVSLHLDHIEDFNLFTMAAELGFDSAMYDGSTLSDEQNVAQTHAAAQWAAEHNIWIEAELGRIGGKGGAHTPGVRTDPTEASDFVAATGVNSLAVAVGSEHAMLNRSATLDNELITELAAALPVPLVLHGSSGVSDEGIRNAVAAGMTKINIGTALNIAFTGSVREVLQDEKVVDPRKYLAKAKDSVAELVAHYQKVVDTPTA